MKWNTPIESELSAMEKHEVWEIVPCVKGMNVIPLKWVFTVKDDGTHKARLVAVGCRDKEEYNPADTTTPTPSISLIRWLFAIVLEFGWKMIQADVKNAFLHSKIDREKFVSIPQGVNIDSKRFVCKLKKALYGLKTAPKCWYNTVHRILTEMGFTRCEREPCLYIYRKGELLIIILVYVDDMIICGNDSEEISRVCEILKNKLEIKIIGIPRKFLGIQIDWQENGNIFLHQSDYTNLMLKVFGTLDCTPVATPMPSHNTQQTMKCDASAKNKVYSYKQAIGAILYLANNTRPDIAYAVNFLSRYQSNPRDLHWTLLD